MSFEQYGQKVIDEAKQYPLLDTNTLLASIDAESAWNPNAKSPTGVKGLMQTTNDVFIDYNKAHGTKLKREENGKINNDNIIKVGTWYKAKIAGMFPDDPDAQIQAYSATGPTGVKKLK